LDLLKHLLHKGWMEAYGGDGREKRLEERKRFMRMVNKHMMTTQRITAI
jgi:hypothetical protein